MFTIIIEDEKPAARLLQRKLEKLGIEASVLLHTVEESINWFTNNKHPDLIFLDIQLSDGLSFEIFEKLTIKSAVIVTTAFDEYALKAFKLNSIDYLLKPIDETELATAISKYKTRLPEATILSNFDFNQIKKLLQNPFESDYKNRFTVKFGSQLKLINLDEIECFYSENKGTYLHTTSKRSYLMDTTLEELMDNDLDPKKFFRISRKFIVALPSVKDIVLYSNSRLKIILPTYNEDEVVVSREKVQDFKNWLG